MNILVIDDSKAIRMLVAECVKALGHRVVHAEDGIQGIHYIEGNEIDLVLMDIEMPGLNGFETTREIRRLKGDDWFPIIFLTVKTDEESYAACINAGGDAYLAKPISPKRLEMQIIAMERIYEMRKKLHRAQKDLMRANEALSYTSLHDQLTGLANRRNFDMTLLREFSRAKREKQPLSLLMCDIDYFKVYNDRYGHMAGDQCLKTVADAIASVPKRATDLACRYGGEEFAVIMPNTHVQAGSELGERIRSSVSAKKILHEGSKANSYVSLSLGLATYYGQFKTIDELMRAADDALYSAKEKGRNRLKIA
ncbi:MAG: diguanylate cyclase [Methylomicrobium sp.]